MKVYYTIKSAFLKHQSVLLWVTVQRKHFLDSYKKSNEINRKLKVRKLPFFEDLTRNSICICNRLGGLQYCRKNILVIS